MNTKQAKPREGERERERLLLPRVSDLLFRKPFIWTQTLYVISNNKWDNLAADDTMNVTIQLSVCRNERPMISNNCSTNGSIYTVKC